MYSVSVEDSIIVFPPPRTVPPSKLIEHETAGNNGLEKNAKFSFFLNTSETLLIQHNIKHSDDEWKHVSVS